MDTIHALATAQGKSGVAIIRLSGERSWEILRTLTGRALPAARSASVRRIVDRDGETLDSALVVLFETGASFTGESSAELHLHGSIAVVAAVLRRIAEVGLSRLAEPGEFTRRALLNDRLDLTEVEGLSDLIEAETELQRREAMRVFSGELSTRVISWRARLIHASALLAATIDFADEDVPVDVRPDVLDLVGSVRSELETEIRGFSGAQELRRGFEVALVGAPNVGKSTLLNAMAGREAAITSEIAGTTRDVVEVRMDLEGLPVTFIDTAGIRDTEDLVEGLGIRRAQDRGAAADLRIHLVHVGDTPVMEVVEGDIVVETKADITGRGISAKFGHGVDGLISEVVECFKGRVLNAGLVSRERDRSQLVVAKGRLDYVCSGLGEVGEELLSMEITGAISGLDAIIGQVGIEDVLDDVFSSFCLGK